MLALFEVASTFFGHAKLCGAGILSSEVDVLLRMTRLGWTVRHANRSLAEIRSNCGDRCRVSYDESSGKEVKRILFSVGARRNSSIDANSQSQSAAHRSKIAIRHNSISTVSESTVAEQRSFRPTTYRSGCASLHPR